MKYLGFHLITTAPAIPSSGVSTHDPVTYTLFGVAITTGVSLLALWIKFWMDGITAERQHSREIAILRLTFDEDHRIRLSADARMVYARLLASTANIYRSVVEARRRRRISLDDVAYKLALSSIDPSECQVALEEVRLIAGPAIVASADAFWEHLRSTSVTNGSDLASQSWVSWKKEYWRLRAEMHVKLRESLGSHQTP